MLTAYYFVALLCFWSFHACKAGNCICSQHVERMLYQCDDTNNMPVGLLYYDGQGPNCMVEDQSLHAKPGWKAGIMVSIDRLKQRIVYVQDDSTVVTRPCTETRVPGLMVESDKTCYPQDALRLNSVDGGWTKWSTWSRCSVTCGSSTTTRTRSCTNPAPRLNGAKCTGPTSESNACGTTPCPIAGGWTAWTAWATCPVTCGTGSTRRSRTCTSPAPKYNGARCAGAGSDTKACGTSVCPTPTVIVPVPTVIPSTKCDSKTILMHVFQKTSANHPRGRNCPQSMTNSETESLLLEACNPSNTHIMRWRPDLKVIDNCMALKQGDPIGMFAGGRTPLFKYATFWRCKVTSFEIVIQECGAPAHIEEVDANNIHYTLDTFYTINF